MGYENPVNLDCVDLCLRSKSVRTIMVLLSNAQDLGIETVCMSSLFLIIFQNKFSLLRSTRATTLMGVVINITASYRAEQNN